MEIKNKKALILGGWGLVGSAISRKIMENGPRQIVIASLQEWEAKEAVDLLRKEYPKSKRSMFVPWWGNIFLRHKLKDKPREEILKHHATRQMLIDDLLDDLNKDVIERSTIYQLLNRHKPDIVVDCINSATAIAYQDLFHAARETRKAMRKSSESDHGALIESTERLIATLYIPQLIRHVQLLYRSMQMSGSRIYVKIGTSGTGGMGLNIPYTHSEERPSSVLLSKSSVAGAHTLLLFLMGRTPDAPITKEIKPTAAIAWKRIGYGEIKKRHKAIQLVDCSPDQGIKLGKTLKLKTEERSWTPLHTSLESVFIDTGENGLFSRGEFESISTPGQMEYVTPEEIAEAVVYEIKGGNTGRDIINALDNATLAPTYRAGFLFESALQEMKRLERKHRKESVAFEILGPPRLSKLLHEAHLLKIAYGSMKAVLEAKPSEMSKKLTAIITADQQVRAEIISIGIPILMADGVTLLRGSEIKIPPYRGENELKIVRKSLETWAHDGWVDLRISNMGLWKERFEGIRTHIESLSPTDTSSRHMRNKTYWEDLSTIEPGKLVGWIFTDEEKGKRMKA
ncbi:MAG: short-chain dehydrogenase [Ignavibacteria bacterium]|nr:short-chain dehydrogenase [Ignavibacteria bacterium]